VAINAFIGRTAEKGVKKHPFIGGRDRSNAGRNLIQGCTSARLMLKGTGRKIEKSGGRAAQSCKIREKWFHCMAFLPSWGVRQRLAGAHRRKFHWEKKPTQQRRGKEGYKGKGSLARQSGELARRGTKSNSLQASGLGIIASVDLVSVGDRKSQ